MSIRVALEAARAEPTVANYALYQGTISVVPLEFLSFRALGDGFSRSGSPGVAFGRRVFFSRVQTNVVST